MPSRPEIPAVILRMRNTLLQRLRLMTRTRYEFVADEAVAEMYFFYVYVNYAVFLLICVCSLRKPTSFEYSRHPSCP